MEEVTGIEKGLVAQLERLDKLHWKTDFSQEEIENNILQLIEFMHSWEVNGKINEREKFYIVKGKIKRKIIAMLKEIAELKSATETIFGE